MNLINKIFRSFTHVVDTDHSHERGEHDSDVADHLQGQGDHLLRLHLVLHHHLHVWGKQGWIMPGHFIPANIITQQQYQMTTTRLA